MKKLILLLAASFIGVLAYSQNKVVLKNATDSASLNLEGSTFTLKIDGEEYIKVPRHNTLFEGPAQGWDDFRVPVTATTAAGSNPPVFAAMINSGGILLVMPYTSMEKKISIQYRQTTN